VRGSLILPALLALGPLVPAAACAAAPPAPAAGQEKPAVIETIDETTVGDLDGTRVPMGNVMNGSYTLPDGTEARGPVCSLALPGDTSAWVGKGSVVTVEGTKWEVLEVVNPPEGLGSVTLKMLQD
jgi:hypothetical protein